jgi:hypothetical protein
MGFNPDSKELGSGAPHVGERALQPTISSQSKAAEAAGNHQNRSIMATIADDDDRLLVRIGYTPVSASSLPLGHLPTVNRYYKDISQDGLRFHMPFRFWEYLAQCPRPLVLQ